MATPRAGTTEGIRKRKLLWSRAVRTKRAARRKGSYPHLSEAQYWRQCARQYRSGTRTRLAKLGRTDELPSIDEVHAWITGTPMVCAYCDEALSRQKFSLDHATPISRNGSVALDNVVKTCPPCNRAKGTMTATEFRSLRALLAAWEDGGKSVFVRLRLGSFRSRPHAR